MSKNDKNLYYLFDTVDTRQKEREREMSAVGLLLALNPQK